MKKMWNFLPLVGGILVAQLAPSLSCAADGAVARVGFVAGAGGYPKMAVTNQAFFDALAEAGYVDGKNMHVVFRTAEGDMKKMPALVQEALAQRVDVLVVSSSPGCAAAKQATTSVPVLCISVQDDPVREGLATMLSHGAGNVVGVHSYLPDGIAQQLAQLQQLRRGLATLGILFNPQNATHLRLLEAWQHEGGTKGIAVVPMPVENAAGLAQAMQAARRQRTQIALGLLGADTYAIRKEIAQAADASDLPVVMDTPGGYTQMGGVATLGVDIVPLYRRGALELMVPMLKGTSPAALPWIGPDRIAIKVNPEVAARFKLTAPQPVER